MPTPSGSESGTTATLCHTMLSNPFDGLGKMDEQSNRKRFARSLTADELDRLLDAAKRRPLEDARDKSGRQTQKPLQTLGFQGFLEVDAGGHLLNFFWSGSASFLPRCTRWFGKCQGHMHSGNSLQSYEGAWISSFGFGDNRKSPDRVLFGAQ